MARNKTIQKKKTFILCILTILTLCLLMVRLGFLMLFCSAHYSETASFSCIFAASFLATNTRIIAAAASTADPMKPIT